MRENYLPKYSVAKLLNCSSFFLSSASLTEKYIRVAVAASKGIFESKILLTSSFFI